MRFKEINFVQIYFLSSFIYYFNLLYGVVFFGSLEGEVDSKTIICNMTYFILILNLVLIFIFLPKHKQTSQYVRKIEDLAEKRVLKAYILIIFVISVVMVYKYDLLGEHVGTKSDIDEEVGGWGTYFKYFASFSFVYYFVNDHRESNKLWAIIAVFPIFSTFLYGNRSFLVISLLAVFFNKLYLEIKKSDINLYSFFKRHKVYILGGLFFVFVTLVVKGIYAAFFSGNTELVLLRLSSSSYYEQVAMVSEPNTIMTNLNTIVSKDYSVNTSSYWGLWGYLVPLFTDQINETMGSADFTVQYQADLFKGMNANRASTYIGEAFANGHIIMVILVISILLLTLNFLLNRYKKCKSNITKSTLLLIAIDLSFYIHRNSMYFEFSRIRFYIYILIMLLLFTNIYRKYSIKNKRFN